MRPFVYSHLSLVFPSSRWVPWDQFIVLYLFLLWSYSFQLCKYIIIYLQTVAVFFFSFPRSLLLLSMMPNKGAAADLALHWCFVCIKFSTTRNAKNVYFFGLECVRCALRVVRCVMCEDFFECFSIWSSVEGIDTNWYILCETAIHHVMVKFHDTF